MAEEFIKYALKMRVRTSICFLPILSTDRFCAGVLNAIPSLFFSFPGKDLEKI